MTANLPANSALDAKRLKARIESVIVALNAIRPELDAILEALDESDEALLATDDMKIFFSKARRELRTAIDLIAAYVKFIS